MISTIFRLIGTCAAIGTGALIMQISHSSAWPFGPALTGCVMLLQGLALSETCYRIGNGINRIIMIPYQSHNKELIKR